MPPHCDTRDRPVVKAAIKALESRNLNYVLIWIPQKSEKELKSIFEKTLRERKGGKDPKDVADDWFFENSIRLHQAGEGAPYTGMKPAGLSEVTWFADTSMTRRLEIQKLEFLQVWNSMRCRITWSTRNAGLGKNSS